MAYKPRDLLYRAYERRLETEVRAGTLPRHVGVILDGNRRWARDMGYASASEGHRRGAAKIDELLGWCADLDIPVVTLWLLSTENLRRDPDEIGELLRVIEEKVTDLARAGRWRFQALGALEMLPEHTRSVLEEARAQAEGREGPVLNVAVGYGGRQEIADATKRLLESYADDGADLAEAAKRITPEEIARFLYTAGLPDPDLIIRPSGEVRLSGFLLWQSAHSEFYFCDPYWPDFRRIDFLRAVRAYQQRQRRFGL
ncbi:MAG: polyprenyl diphosphate synthase [Actinomycetota bacterium]